MDHILSLSGGKDSTAMLLHILELLDSGDDSYPLDEVVFADTGLEYPEMYEHLDKLRKVVVEHDIKWTVLMPEHPFEYYLYEHEYVGKDGTVHHGYGWAGARARWCTRALKTAMTDRMMQDKKSYGIRVLLATSHTGSKRKSTADTFIRLSTGDGRSRCAYSTATITAMTGGDSTSTLARSRAGAAHSSR